MTSDLKISHGKMSDFVSFPFFVFTLVKRLRNFDFESRSGQIKVEPFDIF